MALTKLAYTIILQDVERHAGLTLVNSEIQYAVVTGIQLNGPRKLNFIWLGDIHEVAHGQKTLFALT